MSKKKYEDDDGRQIADMSRTYDISYLGLFGIKDRTKKRKAEKEPSKSGAAQPPLTKRETRKLMINAMLGGLAIGLVFVGAALMFVLFCIFVWFK